MSSSMSKPGSSDPRKAKQEVGSKSKGKVGDWFRHVSSSGKEYYYNITSHASQWEKPREWLDYEKRYGPVPYQSSSSSSSKPNSQHHHHVQQQHSSSSSSSVVEKAIAEREREQREREFRERDRDRDRYHHQQQQQQHHQQQHHPFSNSTSSNMNSSTSSSHSHHSSYAHSSHSSTSSAAYDRQRGEYPVASTSHTGNMLSQHQQHHLQQQQQHSSSSSSHPHQTHSSGMSSNFSHSSHHHSASSTSTSSNAANSNRGGGGGGHNHTDSSAHHSHPSSSSNSSNLHSHHGMHPHQMSNRHFSDGVHLRHTGPSTSAAALRDTRKPSEDLQAEDMDISPLDDSNSPISLDSKKVVASSSSNTRDSHQYPHTSNSSVKADSIDLTRDEVLKTVTSAFLLSQQQMAGRLNMLPGNSSSGNNNGYGGRERDRDREQRDRDRDRDGRDLRDRDMRDNRDRERVDSRDNRDRDNRLHRDRDVRESPRRERDRGRQRDRTDHRERDRDRERENRERDRSRSRLRDERSRSPWDKDGTPERPNEVTGSGNIGSLATLAALSQQPDTETPPLPASLSQYYREDLIVHVKELPGDAMEKQANKIIDEIMTTTAIQISKVSTELKMARSLVRLTDIQATLQEQRILFLRQQIESLEASERDNSSMLGVDTVDP